MDNKAVDKKMKAIVSDNPCMFCDSGYVTVTEEKSVTCMDNCERYKKWLVKVNKGVNNDNLPQMPKM